MKKLIVPMLVVVLAVTSAFTTDFSKNSKEDATIVKGHRKLNPQGTECAISNDCTTINTGVFCRVGNVPAGQQLWDMDEDDKCVLTLYKP